MRAGSAAGIRSALWATTWAVGAAAGTALGAYLTAVGGAGAPGAGQLDTSDLIWVPAASGLSVFAFAWIVGFVRGRGARSGGTRAAAPAADPDKHPDHKADQREG